MYRFLIALIVLSGCLTNDEPPGAKDAETPPPVTVTVIDTEELGDFGEIKNLTLILKDIKKPEDEYSVYQATYIWRGEEYRTGSLNRAHPDNKSVVPLYPPGDQYMRAFEWIAENTSKDALFLSWWDYGDLIRIFSQRESLISDPCSSERCLETLSETETDVFRYEDEEKFADVLRFFTSSEEEAYGIARKYGADYVFVTYEEFPKSWAFNYLAGTQPLLQHFEVPLTGDVKLDAKNFVNAIKAHKIGAYFFKNRGDRHVTWYLKPEDVPKVKDRTLLGLLPLQLAPGNGYTRELLQNFELVYSDDEEYIYIYKVL